MNITQRRLRTIIDDYNNSGQVYICYVSPTFARLWHDSAARRRIRALATKFLCTYRHNNFSVSTASDDTPGSTSLFYCWYMLPTKYRELHRTVRLDFLNWLLARVTTTPQ